MQENLAPPPNVLVITSAQSVAAELSAAMDSDYAVLVQDLGPDRISPALNQSRPDIVVIARPSMDLRYLDAISEVVKAMPIPVLVFVESDPHRMARQAIRAGVTSFVVDGLVAARVPTLIEVTMERFKLSEALRNELLKSQEELAARKIIERAKGLLMDRKQLNEQEAYRTLRELAMRQAKPLKEVAETLITYSDILP
ncbi:MAG: ANTAR domain-containing protein [Pseudomonadota bacterium]